MAQKKPKKAPKTRDYNMVALIKGATKAAVHTDQKKKADKLACRKDVEPANE